MTGPQLRRNLRASYISRYDTGHEFHTVKRSWQYHNIIATARTNWRSGGTTRDRDWLEFHGPIYPSWGPDSQKPPLTGLDDPTLLMMGREAIANTIPLQPEAGVAAAILELREGMPKLQILKMRKALRVQPGESFDEAWKRLSKAGTAGAGSEYLAQQFGFQPLAKDIAKLAVALLELQRRIEQLDRRSGLTDRTRYKFDPWVEHNSTTLWTGEPPMVYLARDGGIDHTSKIWEQGSTTGKVFLEKHTIHKVWFSGAYTYWLPQGNTISEKFRRYATLAETLLGATITPDVVWQVTPWSWLLDWYADLGTFFTNLSLTQADRVLLRYGYLMAETRHEWSKVVLTGAFRPSATGPTALTSTNIVHVKRRMRAEPYGFGVDMNSMSAYRWSILSALGMTQGDRVLRRPKD